MHEHGIGAPPVAGPLATPACAMRQARPWVLGRRRPSGFTLIELLVVIAIIALLIAILLPSLRLAKDMGYRTRCAANMKGLASAIWLYGSYNEDRLVAHNSDGGSAWNNYQGWLYTQVNWNSPPGYPPYTAPSNPAAGYLIDPPANRMPSWLPQGTQIFPPGVTDFSQIRDRPDVLARIVSTGQLWPYTRSFGMYRCPADPPPYAPPSGALPNPQRPWQNRDNYYNGRYVSSYTMNSWAIKANNDKQPRLSTQVLPRGWALWEVDDTFLNWGLWNDGGNQPNEGLTNRHGVGATIGCFDGHAEWIRRKDFYKVQSQVGSLGSGPVNELNPLIR